MARRGSVFVRANSWFGIFFELAVWTLPIWCCVTICRERLAVALAARASPAIQRSMMNPSALHIHHRVKIGPFCFSIFGAHTCRLDAIKPLILRCSTSFTDHKRDRCTAPHKPDRKSIALQSMHRMLCSSVSSYEQSRHNNVHTNGAAILGANMPRSARYLVLATMA